MWKRLFSSPLTWALAVVVVAGLIFGGYWFQPWKLVTDQVVDESVPVVQGTDVSGPTPIPSASASPSPTPRVSPSPAGNQLLAAGEFVTHEHETTGTAQVVQLADGRRQLVLRNFATSNGPDLRVWLSDQPVLEGRAGWFVFDDGEWFELDRLKGNQGNQVYDIPADVDLSALTSVSIWCKRFSVSFGAADLAA
ncbi:DM13 domain-containing protein [Solwaraspora sp. WMMD406]|uniref:DM13 domain-containing protein n=1 Tax=Solwaraspora sp. WMMD406 TaxID=3016095 RepID=UPI002415FB99|nr:DM13 domain-containing protein [Solwaraspora sp. WMMD406]MDG4764108.1 DM13 domain-containing protein [Solwaraspora sp. WMMD406]